MNYLLDVAVPEVPATDGASLTIVIVAAAVIVVLAVVAILLINKGKKDKNK
jgi:hypothetical protein